MQPLPLSRAGPAGVGECPWLGWRGACWEAGDTAPLHDGSPRRLGRVTSRRVLCFSQHAARVLPQLRLEALWESVGQELWAWGILGRAWAPGGDFFFFFFFSFWSHTLSSRSLTARSVSVPGVCIEWSLKARGIVGSCHGALWELIFIV